MLVWILFLAAIFVFLALDLGVFNKNPHVISSKEAGKWTAVWVTLSFAFSGIVYWLYQSGFVDNPDNLKASGATVKYITGYLIELSLSVDNIFVIAIIFSAFKIPPKYQHRVLFWGIIGAILFRGLMIYFGVMLINRFHWITYVFGLFLIFTAIRMLIKGDDENFDPKHSLAYRMIGKIIPTTTHMDGKSFFIIENGKKLATPLFVALLVIEIMDVVFAVDSVPAILAITSDPFLVFSSNIFAILGLRSMYFFLANMIRKFVYVEYSLIAILTFVGIKMLIADWVEFHEWVSLTVIAVALGIGILASLNKIDDETPAK
jgi:tellurite resistance protein TerC